MPELSPGLDLDWQVAAAEAMQGRHERIAPAHLLLGLCSLPGGAGTRPGRAAS